GAPGQCPSLRRGAGGDGEVDVFVAERFAVDPELRCPGLEIRKSRCRRLAHHLAQLPCQPQLAFTGYHGRLHEDDLTAGRGPGQPGRDAGPIDALRGLVEETALAECVAHPSLVYVDAALCLTCCDQRGDPAHHTCDFAFQIAHPCLTRVLPDDQPDRLVTERDFISAEPVGIQLLGDEELAGDVDLLLFGV